MSCCPPSLLAFAIVKLIKGTAVHSPFSFAPGAPLWRRSLLASAVAAALNLMLSQAHAQEADVVPQVMIVGQAATMDSALDVQQQADRIVSVVHADAIGQLPDANAAEALQRVPGVSVERDQGEGRYVRVRGIGPDLNAVTINGSLVPAPEAERRAVALDVLPSGLIRSLEVSKTLTPDMDANSIGGTVEVKTISAFDHKGNFYSLEGGVSRDGNVDRTSPNVAGAWSNKFLNGKLGIAAGLNVSQRKFGSDDVETGGAWDFDGDAAPALKEFQRRDYQIKRERQGALLNLDYRPSRGEAYWLRTLHSRFSDDEVRQRHNIEFDDPMPAGAPGEAESSREMKAREETESITSITFGGEKKFADWKISAAAGFGRADQKTPDAIDAAVFESGETYTAGYQDSRLPRLLGEAAMNNPADYELDAIELSSQTTRDRERNVRVDLQRKISMFGADSALKFGGKISRRNKSSDLQAWEIDGGDIGNPSLSGLLGGAIGFPYGSFGPGPDRAAIQKIVGGVNLADYVNEEESRINDFSMREDINAAYIQNTWRNGPWRVLAGVRYEGTSFEADGVGLNDEDYTAVAARNTYRNWLPALHLRHDLDDDTSVRAAVTHSVVRPTFGQLAPGYVIDGDEASFGNPNLKPLKSRNLDLGIEKRLGYAGVLSAYLFHKDIDNFVYNTDLAGTGAWADFDEANTFSNGKKASIKGLELAWSTSLRKLPAPWNGLLASANATFSESKARIDGFDDGKVIGRDIPMPSSSDRTLNLTLGYEAGPVSVRLASNYKSKYLLEVGSIGSADSDLYVDPQNQVDFSARYNISKQVQIVFEVLNLTDQNYYVYTGRRNLNAQYESYGRTIKLSAKIAAF